MWMPQILKLLLGSSQSVHITKLACVGENTNWENVALEQMSQKVESAKNSRVAQSFIKSLVFVSV